MLPTLGRLVAAIPRPIASALLAGVLLKLCFAPALALGTIPLLVLPVLVAWLIGLRVGKLAAMPFAVIAFVAVLSWYIASGGTSVEALADTGSVLQFPQIALVPPVFTLQSIISVSLPLYLVTMAGQNIPGFTVLELNGYPVERQPLIRNTGLMSLAIAPFGSIPVNMSAITAAMMAGDDAGPDRDKRYWSAVTSGVAYCIIAVAAAAITALAVLAPPALITAVAGLALIPALTGSIAGAFAERDQVEAPALTFLITASGMVLFGISGAFWGLLVGIIVWLVKRART